MLVRHIECEVMNDGACLSKLEFMDSPSFWLETGTTTVLAVADVFTGHLAGTSATAVVGQAAFTGWEYKVQKGEMYEQFKRSLLESTDPSCRALAEGAPVGHEDGKPLLPTREDVSRVVDVCAVPGSDSSKVQNFAFKKKKD
uniref:Uncharacterized protein n=1 Tax=Chromera velia CCMP2878 TaxID=1169474 RepID=A0A0G4G8X2_9ALVE|eukprot:Cvel_596.t1-p1 / transcript=Cvel_596.t1 / gene=Cvel_596 / organism=Chromera_velia_CCMP2878 / gene_product=hypothetical protein / transcript_product=hypothetical protein / location=Cvel_scaffold18:140841-141263(+) / protein_length=141 / sequence_SO=supercontig / SO=protein_coding / is_pseudo=false